MNNYVRTYSVDSEGLFSKRSQIIEEAVDVQSDDYILNVGTVQYIEYVKSISQLDFPDVFFDRAYFNSYETEMLGSSFPASIRVNLMPYKKYKIDVIEYHIPYQGDINILSYKPLYKRTVPTTINLRVDIQRSEIIFEILNHSDNPVYIEAEYERFRNNLFGNVYNDLKTEVEAFNNNLENNIKSLVDKRREKIARKHNIFASLSVPFRQTQDVSPTFSVPRPQIREKISIDSIGGKNGFSPEPTLEKEDYFKILKIINDVGLNIERMPSLHKNREETFRDFMILVLDPNFVMGSATGETFNLKGKTDILLRYDSQVVFIAECKIWSGEKDFNKAIDQLLGYLTYRDSKTSLVIFVRENGFDPIVEKARQSMRNHTCFIKEESATSTTWFNYTFSLPNEPNKEIKISLQIFHLKPINSKK